MPEFCEDIEDWDGASTCPTREGQHPCWSCKMSYWQNESSLQLGKSAIPSRFRQDRGKKRVEAGQASPPPAGVSESSIAMDHAIPKDERGLPFIGSDLDPFTSKEIRNMGSGFEGKRKELASRDVR